MKKIIIGSRGSVLALWQAHYIQDRLKAEFGMDCEIKVIKTKGDKILDVPLAKIGGKGLFTKELEEALFSGEIDIAVHSLKDVPIEIPNNLTLVAITKREDIRDCFISEKYESLEDLPRNAIVGTTSLRRSMQIMALRGDIDTHSLRGNIQSRIQKLKNNEFDAIILAKAGVNRLGLSDIKYINAIPISTMLPAMGQGALGIECRDDFEYLDSISGLNDAQSALSCMAERAFVGGLDGGCQVPIGVNASISGDNIKIWAKVGLPDGSKILEFDIVGKKEEYSYLSSTLVEKFECMGARDLLRKAKEMAFA